MIEDKLQHLGSFFMNHKIISKNIQEMASDGKLTKNIPYRKNIFNNLYGFSKISKIKILFDYHTSTYLI